MRKPLSRIEVSQSALVNNIKQFKKLLPKGSKLVVVVKANAYGHGMREVVEISENIVDAFQVDDIEELRILRQETQKETFVLGYVQKSELAELVDLNGVLGCYNIETIRELEKIGRRRNRKIKIHLKIDALLGRQGIFLEDLKKILNFIKKSRFIILESVYSHFSNIEDADNLEHTKKQFNYLMIAKEKVKDFGFKNITHHISATGGFLSNLNNNWNGSLVRLGIGMYGLWPSEIIKNKFRTKLKLKPVLRWVSGVAQIKKVPKNFPIGYGLTYITEKPMTIAVIPQGYSDGYDRGLSNNSYVLIRGKRCEVIGRVAMNMFVVNVTNVRNIKLEDEVVLLGKQKKDEIIAEFLADKIGTINYEIVARISPHLPRVATK